MKSTKKTSDWLVFVEMATRTVKEETVSNTKLGTILRKQAKVVNTALEDYRDKIEDLRIDHCSVDEKQNIIKDSEGQYIFTKEKLKAFGTASKKLLNTDLEVEIFLKEEQITSVEIPVAYSEYFLEFIGVEETV